MSALLRLELIGDNWQAYRRASERNPGRQTTTRDMIKIIRYGRRELATWVAQILPRNQRKFLNGVQDYSNADALGERGIVRLYALEPGIYEVNECTALGHARRYFVRVIDATLAEISREEVDAWLKSCSE